MSVSVQRIPPLAMTTTRAVVINFYCQTLGAISPNVANPPDTTQTAPSSDFISSLPYEVAVRIIGCLESTSSLAVVSRLSRRWNHVGADNEVWRRLYIRRWGCVKELTERLTKSKFFNPMGSSSSLVPSVETLHNPNPSVFADSSISKASVAKFKDQLQTFPVPVKPEVTCWDPRVSPESPRTPTVSNVQSKSLDSNFNSGAIHHDSFSSRMDVSEPVAALPQIWKTVYRQRLILLQNWRDGDYTVRSFTGHSDAVYCIQFDKNLLASGSRDKTLKFWDMNDVRCTRILTGHRGSVLCMQHDAANYIVTGSSDSTAIVWDYVTGRPLRWLNGHSLPVLDIRFDSRRIVTCSKDCTVKIWELESGALLHSMDGHQAAVNAVHMHGSLVVSASGDCVVKMWNLNTGALVRNFVGHTRGLACVQFDGDTVLSGSNDFTIKVWDAHTGVCLNTLEGHTNLVRTLCFDEQMIVSGSYDNTIKVWDRKTGALLHTLAGVHSSWVFHVQMDSSRIVSSAQDKKIAIWEFGRGCQLVNEFI
ncbi:hypothetical protein CcCBS67573_g01531 [Chytriomyces confervae]|uniref:F-box domain-containing protein n=1 Tax=Chytriomyces confervae TaxID=246404 RepID=A0A507FLE2_9FUNG|nr:hypothetical protein CcCBS67573_g01531 [Chytriomyces confervae]